MAVPISLPSSVRLEQGPSGLPRVSVDGPAALAEVYLQGAHVTRWQPAGCRKPVLWTSGRSWFEPGKPIRGGVPICFPWFGAHPGGAAPVHGFARLLPWALVDAREDDEGVVTVELELSGEGLSPEWPHRFTLRHRIRAGSTLRLELEVRNTGSEPFTFEEALHSYFAVSDVRNVSVSGLEGVEYLDKVAAFALRRQGAEPVRFTGETDRVYLGTQAACGVHDPGAAREIAISKTGSDATVVWNPWIAKARAMPDFGDDEWPEMVCVETANVDRHARTLAPGASHTMAAVVEVKVPAEAVGSTHR